MSDPRGLKAALIQASSAIESNNKYEKSKTEERLGRLGDGVQKGLQMATVGGALSADNTQDALNFVKAKIDSFLEDSKYAIKVLDEIGKIHPFIQVAVSAFKVALNFELTRRGNDEKVLALKVQMKEMMMTLYVLQDVDPNDSTVSALLTDRLLKVTESIKECAEVCEAYQKQKLIVKFFASHSWEGKFGSVSQQFDEHTTKLQSDLAVHTNRGVASANQMLLGIQSDLGRLMKLVFESFRSSNEREISSFVTRYGGPEKVLKNDILLGDLIVLQRQQMDGPRKPACLNPPDRSIQDEVLEVRKETQKDIGKILEENKKTFDQRFEAQRAQIEEVRSTVVKEGDRIISTIVSGPHDRIVNKDIYHVWKENRWKTSVKTVHLVLALHDHYTRPHSQLVTVAQAEALAKVANMVSPLNPEFDARQVEEVADTAQQEQSFVDGKDEWALEYIGVHHVRPLIEAIDVDMSSFVSIAEINTFTAARPAEWSLLHWLTYWTVGFDTTVRWYYMRITVLFAKIELSSQKTLPVNRQNVTAFLRQISYVDEALAGVLQAANGSYYLRDPRYNLWTQKFKSYADQEERRMYEVLKRVGHYIDNESTLSLIVGGTVPEQYILPLTFLLLQRACDLIEHSKSNILDDGSLEMLSLSFSTCYTELQNRKEALHAILLLHNRDSKEYLKRYYHGLYLYIFGREQGGDYWKHDPYKVILDLEMPDLKAPSLSPNSEDTVEGSAVVCTPPPSISGLEYLEELLPGSLRDNLLLQAHERDHVQSRKPDEATPDGETGKELETGNPLAGYWKTSCTLHYENGRKRRDTFGRLMLDSTSLPHVSGFGTDSTGDFLLNGTLNGKRFTLHKDYGMLKEESELGGPARFTFTGLVDDSFQSVVGRWSPIVLPTNPPSGEATLEPEDALEAGSSNEDLSQLSSAQYAAEEGEIDFAEVFSDEARPPEDRVQRMTFSFTRSSELASISYLSEAGPELTRSRALWRIACNAALYVVRHTHFREETLQHRREMRELYTSLLLERKANGNRLPTEKKALWRDLVRENSLEDLRFWKMTGHYYARQCEIAHTMVFCDNCSTQDIASERYTCLPCSGDEVLGSIDLCSNCMDKPLTVLNVSGIQKEHLTSHHLLQTRVPYGTRYGFFVRGRAKGCVESLLQGDSSQVPQTCASCRETISKPYWFCESCRTEDGLHTYICLRCNDDVSKSHPWIAEAAGRPLFPCSQNGHDWSHRLILLPNASDDVPDKLSTESRLSYLENTLHNSSHETSESLKAMSVRIDRLEALVVQILEAVKKA